VKLIIDPLAYYTAKTNGLDDTALDVLEEAGMTEDDLPPPPQNSGHSTLAPPSVTFPQADSNWPSKNLGESFFDRALANGSTENFVGQEPQATTNGGDQLDAWANEEEEGENGEEEDEGWDLDAEVIVIPEEEEVVEDDAAVEGDFSEGVSAGVAEDEMWIKNSPLAADHAAAGAFESAMQVSLSFSFFLLIPFPVFRSFSPSVPSHPCLPHTHLSTHYTTRSTPHPYPRSHFPEQEHN
jgi:coatomer protein complex subunit alpha (xenin)